jgi:hypothetical protein
MTKCKSVCKDLAPNECNRKITCKYCDGRIRHYCRLSHKYKYDDNCNLTRKVIKKEQKPGSKIAKFIRKTKNMRVSNFLKNVCQDSGQCLSFGTETDKINNFFGGFKEFKYVNGTIDTIASGANGFVKEIKYTHRGYNAYALLKSNMSIEADNLYYEYLVGQYINNFVKVFPCFLQTYGLYKYNSVEEYNKMKRSKNTEPNVLKSHTSLITKPSLADVCTDTKLYCILIQHIKSRYGSVKSLDSMLKDKSFLNNDYLYVLLQVYIPLHILCNNFTHYDLHNKNVLLYTLPNNSYIEYFYHMKNGNIVSFRSKYLVKIIDYGRSFFKDDENKKNSDKIYKKVCKTSECDPDCGLDYGFAYLSPEEYPGQGFFISSRKRNMSHDLRLINDCILITAESKFPKFLLKIRDILKYGVGIADPDEAHFGTKENTKKQYPNSINNVSDLTQALIDEAMVMSTQKENELHYSKYKCYGKMDIYCDSLRASRFLLM